MPSRATNHTTKRVPEFCLPTTRSRIQARQAIVTPSAMPFSMRAVEACAMSFTCRMFPASTLLALLQHLAETRQLFRINGVVLQYIQHELLMGIGEKSAHQSPYL